MLIFSGDFESSGFAAPRMRITASEPNATYITVNRGEVFIADNIREKSFGIDGSLIEVLESIAKKII